jgi:hypothetical protein
MERKVYYATKEGSIQIKLGSEDTKVIFREEGFVKIQN